eukprot:4497899-Prymnesium_polylepis.1
MEKVFPEPVWPYANTAVGLRAPGGVRSEERARAARSRSLGACVVESGKGSYDTSSVQRASPRQWGARIHGRHPL